MSCLPAEGGQPFQGGPLNVGFGEGGHGGPLHIIYSLQELLYII